VAGVSRRRRACGSWRDDVIFTVNKHWASDVTFGAIVGITCGRAVTVRVRVTRMALVPQAVPGGGAVLVTAMRRPV
jgi:membrane-associated phospholipid phosphatase